MRPNRKDGLNGGLTDPRLGRWFRGVAKNSTEYRHVFDKVQRLLADNGKAFRKKPHLRFHAPSSWKAPVKDLGISNRNLYIGGEWVDSSAGSSYEVRNPAHRYHVLAEVQAAGVEDAEKAAVAAAAYAASSWAATPAPQRADILYRVHELMRDRREEFARLITLEEGKSLPDARAEVQRSLNIIQYAAGEGRRMFGYTTPSETRDTVAYTLRRSPGSSGRHHAVELPAGHPSMEDCASAYLRQRRGLQTSVVHPTKRNHADRDLHRSGPAAGGIEPGHRAGRLRGQLHGEPSGYCRDILHRLHGDWHGALRPGCDDPEEGAVRDGGQRTP